MKRNICNLCKNCKDSDKSIPYCFDVCGAPIDILTLIEEQRNESLEQKSEWIPVTERLPKEMGMYLVTLDYGKKHGKAVASLYFHNDKIGWQKDYDDIVLAWMTLPEPYKAGE